MIASGICGGAMMPRLWCGLQRAGFLIVLMALAAGLFAPAANANPKFAAVTVDARNGKILFAENADAIRHPASLTKMMTLYIVFQELQSGRLKLNSPIRMSARAAGMAPSKLGVKAGGSITVETAIRALVVKSANDVAAAVAESISGSEKAFAARMTRQARALGMPRTVFANASGLPNPRQVTTARDMATLGLRLMRDFPQYYPYFRTKSFVHAGRTIRGHNKLLGTYDGTDGIKTGYINASGFNLVTSVRRGEKRLVGVVMGGRTGASRDAYMKKMLTSQFGKARRGKTIAAIAGSSKGAIVAKEQRQATASKKQRRSSKAANDQPAAPQAQQPIEQGDASDGLAGLAAQAAADTQLDPNVEVMPAPTPEPGEASTASTLPLIEKTPSEMLADKAAVASISPAFEGNWMINLGDYATKTDAQAVLRELRENSPDILSGRVAQTVMVDKSGAITYRARFTGFNEQTAESACRAIRKRNVPCRPQGPA